MISSKVALRYAKSLFSLAQEKGVAEVVNNDMQLIFRAIENTRELDQLLKSPIVNCDRKASILLAIFNGKVSDITLNLLKLLTHKRREAQLAGIAFHYEEIYKESRGIVDATVTTAFKMDDTLKQELLGNIQKANAGKKVELVEKIDKSIIGGFVLRVGDKQHDASIASSLRRLTKDFSGNQYIKHN